MFFTQDDYKKIQQWLTKNSVRDTEFNEANIPFNGGEIITVVQDNQNKKVPLRDLVSQIFNLGVSDFINVTDKYDAPNIDLNEAIKLIPSRARKEGQVITFLNKENNWQIYQFRGVLNQWSTLDKWEDLFDWEKFVIDSILPDEEDLTKSLPDKNGNSYLTLKDREYNPEDFSGLGRIILRKNIIDVEDPVYGKVRKNVLYQDMFTQENTIYEIRYDFDLNGLTITIPKECVLDFLGGSFANGLIIFTNTILLNNINIKNTILISGTLQNFQANIKNFGAISDNTNIDNSIIILSLIDCGCSIFIPKGTFTINTPIIIKSNTTIIGESSSKSILSKIGDSSILYKNTSYNCAIVTDIDSKGNSIYTSEVFISNFRLEGNNKVDIGILLLSNSKSVFSRLQIVKFKKGIFAHSVFLNTFNAVACYYCDTSFDFNTDHEKTTLNLVECYSFGALNGYCFRKVNYSFINNCACDSTNLKGNPNNYGDSSCKGQYTIPAFLYLFINCYSVTLAGCGAELSCTANIMIDASSVIIESFRGYGICNFYGYGSTVSNTFSFINIGSGIKSFIKISNSIIYGENYVDTLLPLRCSDSYNGSVIIDNPIFSINNKISVSSPFLVGKVNQFVNFKNYTNNLYFNNGSRNFDMDLIKIITEGSIPIIKPIITDNTLYNSKFKCIEFKLSDLESPPNSKNIVSFMFPISYYIEKLFNSRILVIYIDGNYKNPSGDTLNIEIVAENSDSSLNVLKSYPISTFFNTAKIDIYTFKHVLQLPYLDVDTTFYLRLVMHNQNQKVCVSNIEISTYNILQ